MMSSAKLCRIGGSLKITIAPALAVDAGFSEDDQVILETMPVPNSDCEVGILLRVVKSISNVQSA